jgi:putative hydrolase of the HAD superfamily
MDAIKRGVMVKAVIFDLYGVIFGKTVHLTYRALGGNLDENIDFISRVLRYYDLGWLNTTERDEQLAGQLGVSLARWQEVYNSVDQRDQALLDYIAGLRTKYKTGLLSNCGKGGFSRYFTDEELRRYFDVTIASGDVGMVKPDPAIFHLMAEKLGVLPAECVMVDDSPGHIAGAEAAGLQGLVYTDIVRLKADLEPLLNPADS